MKFTRRVLGQWAIPVAARFFARATHSFARTTHSFACSTLPALLARSAALARSQAISHEPLAITWRSERLGLPVIEFLVSVLAIEFDQTAITKKFVAVI